MNPNQIVEDAKKRMQGAVVHFQDELKKLRTGRAHPSMLDGIVAEAYGTPMPLIQLATISAPEPQSLQISPFDPSTIQAIAKAIRENPSLGLNPIDDGRVVRVPIPPLTTERRQQIVKSMGEKTEDCMIAMRQARQQANREADQAKKDKTLAEDEVRRIEKQVDEAMAGFKEEVDKLAKAKEQEIMTV